MVEVHHLISIIISKLFVDRIGSRTVRSEAEYEEILRDLEEKEVASCFLKVHI